MGAWQGRLRQALARLDRADRLQGGKSTHGSLKLRARCLAGLGDAPAAARASQQAEQTPPALAADFYLLALESFQRDEARQAVVPLSSAARLQPGHFGANYLLAVCRLREGRPLEASQGLSRCLEQRPGFVWPRLLRSYAEMELGQFEAARADLDAVIAGTPDEAAHYVALVNRSVLALRRADWPTAVKDLQRAIALRPDAAPAYLNLALTHRERIERPGWQTALLALPPHGGLPYLAVEAHRRRCLAEATAALDEAIRRLPTTARLYHERGRLHLLGNDDERARADFRRAIELAPRGPGSTLADDLLELGRLLHRGGDHAGAVQCFNDSIKARPDQEMGYRLLAEPLLALGRYREAGDALDRYLKAALAGGRPRGPGQAAQVAEAYRARGLVYSQLGDLRAARECYTLGLGLSREPRLLLLRGWAYLQEGAAPLAERDFSEAAQLQPGDGEAYVGRAEANSLQGRASAALDDADKGLRRGPHTPRLLYAAARVYARAASPQTPADRAARNSTAARYEAQAARLLAQALDRLPAQKRPGFWRTCIAADSTLASVRLHPDLRRWAMLYQSDERPSRQ